MQKKNVQQKIKIKYFFKKRLVLQPCRISPDLQLSDLPKRMSSSGLQKAGSSIF